MANDVSRLLDGGSRNLMDHSAEAALVGEYHSLAKDLSLMLLVVVDMLVAQRGLDCTLFVLALAQSMNLGPD